MNRPIFLAASIPVLLGVAPIQPNRPLNDSFSLVYPTTVDGATAGRRANHGTPSPEDINYFIGRKCNDAFDEIKTIRGYTPAKAIGVVIDSLQDVLTHPPTAFDDASLAKQSEFLLHRYCLAHHIDKNNEHSVNSHVVEVVAYSCGLFIGTHLYHQLDKKYISALKKGFEEASSGQPSRLTADQTNRIDKLINDVQGQ